MMLRSFLIHSFCIWMRSEDKVRSTTTRMSMFKLEIRFVRMFSILFSSGWMLLCWFHFFTHSDDLMVSCGLSSRNRMEPFCWISMSTENDL